MYIYFLRPGKDIRQYGPWAVVTGGTDGIGRAYANALAKKGNLSAFTSVSAKLGVVMERPSKLRLSSLANASNWKTGRLHHTILFG